MVTPLDSAILFARIQSARRTTAPAGFGIDANAAKSATNHILLQNVERSPKVTAVRVFRTARGQELRRRDRRVNVAFRVAEPDNARRFCKRQRLVTFQLDGRPQRRCRKCKLGVFDHAKGTLNHLVDRVAAVADFDRVNLA
jgi:hypothetical protein